MKFKGGLFVFLVTASCLSHAQIAFVKANSLYVLPCDHAGRPTAPAFRVCRLWRHYNGDRVEIGWTPDRKIVLVHRVDAWNGPKRFGLSQDAPASGISIVEAKPNARMKWLTGGYSPTFTPDGRQMVYGTGYMDGKLQVLNLKTGAKSTFLARAIEPVLSWDGTKIALIKVDKGPNYACHVEVRSFPSGKPIATYVAGNPMDLQFAPSGKILAIHHHLSRPLTGHALYPVGKDQAVDFPTPSPFAPAVIDDWSPNSRTVLCEWRIVDPKNDGSWVRTYVGLTPLGPGKARRIALGESPMFSIDGKHVLYLSDHRTGVRAPEDLVWKPLAGKPARSLVKNIAGFSVYRNGSRGLVWIAFHDPNLI